MPLTSVCRKVSSLEAHLRRRLFNRFLRSLTLTDAGRTYLAEATRILEKVDSAAGEFSAPRGALIVFGRTHVAPVATALLQAYLEVDVRLGLADRLMHLVETTWTSLSCRAGALRKWRVISRQRAFRRAMNLAK